MKNAIADYRSCAQLVFSKIHEQWSSWTTPPQFNFWRVGNAFDTLVDYFVHVDASNVGLAASALRLFNGGKGGAWFDDFGWWGIAFLRAARQASLLHIDPTTCLNNSTFCWQKMANATSVWDRADQQYFREAKPRFTGGCWNHDFEKGDSSECNPLSDQATSKLCGFQNTVTNGQYLVLAARLFQQTQPPNPDLKAAAQREWDWFSDWFYSRDLTADEKLLDEYTTFAPTRKLVRERVSTYAFLNPFYPPVRDYEKGLYWAGDQGIILGAMVDLILILGDPKLYDVAIGILEGVQDRFVVGKGILQPWIPTETFQGDSADYATGIGIYMRYLLYAFQNSPTLKQHIQQTYQQFLRANADSICDSQGKLNPCPPLPDWTTIDPMECLLNRLAVLNAAIVIVGP